jgi:hypothetical protein
LFTVPSRSVMKAGLAQELDALPYLVVEALV